MDLTLIKSTVLQTEPLSHKGTAVLLPPGKKGKVNLVSIVEPSRSLMR